MDIVALSLRTMVAGAFAVSAFASLIGFGQHARTLWTPAIPTRMKRLVQYGLAGSALGAEAMLAVFLVAAASYRVTVASLAVIAVLTTYGALSIRATGSCGCFGRSHATSLAVLLARNGSLALGLVPGFAVPDIQPTSVPMVLVLSMVIPWLLTVAFSGVIQALQTTGVGPRAATPEQGANATGGRNFLERAPGYGRQVHD